ncbi:zinc finger MYM-type protein [Trifolium repens]|nr:zinc finger MYM-type protein [Trifolium repens]
MRKFLVPKASIDNVNVVQSEAGVEKSPPNVANEFNSNEIVRDPGLRKQINEYAPDIQDQVRRTYILKGPTQLILELINISYFHWFRREFAS